MITVVLGDSCIEVTPQGGATQIIPRDKITSVDPVTFQSITQYDHPQYWKYRYDSMTVIVVWIRRFKDKYKLEIELQDVSNQPTWSTADQSGINAAISDILDWLNSSVCFWSRSGCFWSKTGCFWN